ncbi:MAG: hypothetical protein ACO3A2_01775 [Bdellovibrionia bacterium]
MKQNPDLATRLNRGVGSFQLRESIKNDDESSGVVLGSMKITEGRLRQ